LQTELARPAVEAYQSGVTRCGIVQETFIADRLSESSLAGQAVAIKEVDDGIWLVTFMDYDLGYIDPEEKTLKPLDNPFGPKVSPVRSVTYVSGPDPRDYGGEGGIFTPVYCHRLPSNTHEQQACYQPLEDI
jgi:hypothetical protein